jgi:F-type H+-transporting ATPase subunit delta
MFLPERWAQAFIRAVAADAAAAGSPKAPGDDPAVEGLAFIKILSPVIRSVKGDVSGTAAAAQLEGMVRAAFAASAGSRADGANAGTQAAAGSVMPRHLDLALCLVLLLVKKNLFRHIDRVILAIEQELDTLGGILRVHLESAQPATADFLDDLKQTLMKKTGASGVRMDTAVEPELLAGYRLRIGSEGIDASLRALIKQLGTELASTGAVSGDAVYGDAPNGGF